MKQLSTQELMNINGGTKYASLRYLELTGRSGDTFFYRVALNDPDSYLNVRDEPSKNGKIIGKLYDGDKVASTFNGRHDDVKGWTNIEYMYR
ncbi:bacteriocin [Tepidibacter formicigenes]|jgi:bacteriocin-like protein|uniref:Bacteriocin-type signal sequence-containing protein n=1 Tax=Tepidibacter formicigenes DSM 15518 TaxID=1123349 RepID=A0A1M6NDD0_9FIRM|nr:SH3 domain-containing protein [Tepidibacter formicigenes]SHJ93619.1 bacteriocin-type signal sequence-containing protein [Tepidibacter formicigenes DSM 15518]